MSLSLDHVVILVSDLDAAIADYTALGFNVQPGGTHAEGATHNALIVFEDGSYLELIAFLHRRVAHRWGPWFDRGHVGFVDFALLPTTVTEVIARAHAGGVDYRGPIDSGRTRPDGAIVRWQLGTAPSRDLPFLCGDVTPRALRVQEGAVRLQPNGVRGVASLTVLVADVDASLARYTALLGQTSPAAPTHVAGLGLSQATLPIGTTTLVLVAPGPDPEAPGAVALRARLADTGEGVIGLSLAADATRSLPRSQTHGAAIDLQRG